MPAAMWPDVFIETLVAEGYRVVTSTTAIAAARHACGCRRAEHSAVDDTCLLRRRHSPLRPHRHVGGHAGRARRGRHRTCARGRRLDGRHDRPGLRRAVSAAGPDPDVVMSTTGNPRRASRSASAALRALLKRPPGDRPRAGGRHLLFVFGVIGSPGFQQHTAQLRPHFERVARRASILPARHGSWRRSSLGRPARNAASNYRAHAGDPRRG